MSAEGNTTVAKGDDGPSVAAILSLTLSLLLVLSNLLFSLLFGPFSTYNLEPMVLAMGFSSLTLAVVYMADIIRTQSRHGHSG